MALFRGGSEDDAYEGAKLLASALLASPPKV